MLIKSIIIRLTRKGAGVSPDYTIEIRGDGSLIYEGRDNVKTVGRVDESISEGKFMALLSEFKTSDFFSFKDNYVITDTVGKPYTIVSISLPNENNEIITKSITHYHGDQNVPEHLKNLEKKIEDVVGSEKWVGSATEFSAFKPRRQLEEKFVRPVQKDTDDPYHTDKKSRTKLIAVFVSIIVIASVLFLAFSFLPASSESKIYSSPIIKKMYTTDEETNSAGNYTKVENFAQNDTINIYLECENISEINGGSQCNINLDFVISKGSFVGHSFDFVKTSIDDYYSYAFETSDEWPIGEYTVTLTLTDKVSSKEIVKQISFDLYEELQITELDPATYINGYQDYGLYYSFNQGDKIFLYQEHSGFAVTPSGECDVYFELEIKLNGETTYTNYSNLTDPDKIAYAWWLTTDETWGTGLYFATVTMTDAIYLRTVSRTTTFTIV